MKPFLYSIAEELYSKHGDRLRDVCVVFPNRRAGLFLKKYLAEIINKNFWSPFVFSIEDFIYRNEPGNIADDITLVFELFHAYKKYEPSETIERFYSWGVILLEDFNEIDKNLVNAELLFKRITDYKNLEKEFDFLNDGDKQELKRFLEAFTGKETPYKKTFTEIWEVIGKVYHDFRKNLTEKNIAYPGMIYRKFVENLQDGKGDSPGRYKKIYFAGFNELSRAEEKIIKILYEKKLAEIYFDADKYYLNDEKQEAGKFLRKFKRSLKLKDIKWEFDLLSKEGKNISIFSTPLITAQVKAVCNELKKLSGEDGFIPEKTAVIIPEESLLLPLLNSIPENIKDVNITLGYSLKNTSLFTLINYIKDLRLNSFERKGKFCFSFEEVNKVLNHPYIKTGGEKVKNFISAMTKDLWINIPRDEIYKNFNEELIRAIFNIKEIPDDELVTLSEILNLVRKGIGENISLSFIEREQFFHFYKHINLLKIIVKNTNAVPDRELVWDLIIEALRNQKIPFTGEPLKGVQILGTLESRMLDFDNIFILSMNEGSFPVNKVSNSFIPYNLRKAFGLPVFDDDQCSSAYIFYRLLQRAKNVNLFYNSDPASFSKGEKSRFITQLEHELSKKNSNVSIGRKDISFPSTQNDLREIKVGKTGEIIESLKRRKYSPSALTTYVNCPLQFYFKYIANLDEPEAVEDRMDAMQFGTIFHETMKNLYSGFLKKTIEADDLERVKKNVDENLDEVFRKVLGKQSYDLSGRNLLMKKILRRLTLNMIDLDKENAPFKILELEKVIESDINLNGSLVSLKGIIDRVDEVNGVIRILDYKTGKVEIIKKNKDIFADHFENIVSKNNKEMIQAYFYAYLYLQKNNEQRISVSICSIKSFSSGYLTICDEENTMEDLTAFEGKLKNILEELFDPEKYFQQTDDIERCKYCSYRSICIRE